MITLLLKEEEADFILFSLSLLQDAANSKIKSVSSNIQGSKDPEDLGRFKADSIRASALIQRILDLRALAN